MRFVFAYICKFAWLRMIKAALCGAGGLHWKGGQKVKSNVSCASAAFQLLVFCFDIDGCLRSPRYMCVLYVCVCYGFVLGGWRAGWLGDCVPYRLDTPFRLEYRCQELALWRCCCTFRLRNQLAPTWLRQCSVHVVMVCAFSFVCRSELSRY